MLLCLFAYTEVPSGYKGLFCFNQRAHKEHIPALNREPRERIINLSTIIGRGICEQKENADWFSHYDKRKPEKNWLPITC